MSARVSAPLEKETRALIAASPVAGMRAERIPTDHEEEDAGDGSDGDRPEAARGQQTQELGA